MGGVIAAGNGPLALVLRYHTEIAGRALATHDRMSDPPGAIAMKLSTALLVVGFSFASAVSVRHADAGSPPSRASRADNPPRKVVVGTVIFGTYGKYPGLDERLKQLGGIVDEMARQASAKYSNRGLDLAILPETAVTASTGNASERAARLEGTVREFFSALARKHRTYLVVPMDLAEDGPAGSIYSNSAILFDRKGEVAGIYRKLHPVAVLGTDVLEGGITPGRDDPVFTCDFGKLGIQICWDIQFDEGWTTLANKGAEIVAWPTASPATAQPAARAAAHRYYIVSSTPREDATIFEPTGMIAAQVEEQGKVLVQQLDLSFAVLGWSAPLQNGKALTEKFGDRVGYHYSVREDLGLFWSNDPRMTVGEMIRTFGFEEIDSQVARNRRLYDAARAGDRK
jgi:predicted amidohydrolase